jgi:enoyl-CoA hydratase
MIGTQTEVKTERKDDDLVILERDGQLARLTLNRPDQRNPLNWSTIKALRACVAEVESDADITVVLVRGAGHTFSAGGDLIGYMDLYRSPERFAGFLEDFYLLFEEMEHSSKIYISVIEGYCVAGGLELLLACDIAVAARSAKIGDCHLNFGQLPGAGGSQRLPRAIGPMRARYMMATGKMIDATEAERIGLLSQVFPDDELEKGIDDLVADLSRKSPLGLKGLKYLVNEGLQGDLQTGLRLEIDHVLHYATTAADASEGLVAFQQKRHPRFTGR